MKLNLLQVKSMCSLFSWCQYEASNLAIVMKRRICPKYVYVESDHVLSLTLNVVYFELSEVRIYDKARFFVFYLCFQWVRVWSLGLGPGPLLIIRSRLHSKSKIRHDLIQRKRTLDVFDAS